MKTINIYKITMTYSNDKCDDCEIDLEIAACDINQVSSTIEDYISDKNYNNVEIESISKIKSNVLCYKYL